MADAPPLKAWIVTLNFGEGGPLATNIWLAPDEASAAALHTIDVLRRSKTENALVGCHVGELSADHLRHLLRGVEGKIPEGGKATVVRLVPESPVVRAAELLRTAPHEAVPVADLSWARGPGLMCYGEYFGPPMPDHLPPVA